jgi:pimeloyl-ACP methyl ester carboxylesterase
MPVLFPRRVRDGGNRVGEFLRQRGIRAPHLAELWSAYASLAEPENRHAFVRTLRAVVGPRGQTVSAADRLYLARAVPSLIVWGERDEIIPVEHAYRAHGLLPGSRLEIFEDAGHFPHAEQPARFAELLTDFIAQTEPARGDPAFYRELLRACSA